MLVTISPAKRLDFSPSGAVSDASFPAFQADAFVLARSARRLSVARVQSLMSISEALAVRARDHFRSFAEAPGAEDVKPAVLAFAGDTYLGFEAASLEPDELDYAQAHLRILSGLYGVLRPKDLIQPYRLEMGSRLATRRGKTLYAFWGARIAEALNAAAADAGAGVLVNCASVEYFAAIRPEVLGLRVVTPVFMDIKDGQPKIISFFAKKARGAMARYIIQNRLRDPEALNDFDVGGYRFRAELSEPDRPVFLRDAEAQT